MIGNGDGNWQQPDCGEKTINDGKWHYITGVYNRTALVFSCYVDGTNTGSVTLLNTFPGMSDSQPHIGGSLSSSGYYSIIGQIDNLRVYASNLEGISN